MPPTRWRRCRSGWWRRRCSLTALDTMERQTDRLREEVRELKRQRSPTVNTDEAQD